MARPTYSQEIQQQAHGWSFRVKRHQGGGSMATDVVICEGVAITEYLARIIAGFLMNEGVTQQEVDEFVAETRHHD